MTNPKSLAKESAVLENEVQSRRFQREYLSFWLCLLCRFWHKEVPPCLSWRDQRDAWVFPVCVTLAHIRHPSMYILQNRIRMLWSSQAVQTTNIAYVRAPAWPVSDTRGKNLQKLCCSFISRGVYDCNQSRSSRLSSSKGKYPDPVLQKADKVGMASLHKITTWQRPGFCDFIKADGAYRRTLGQCVPDIMRHYLWFKL